MEKDNILNESLLQEGAWSKTKYMLSKLGRLEKGGKVWGRGDQQRKAKEQIAKMLQNQSHALVAQLESQLKKDYPEFPNMESKEKFVDAASQYLVFYNAIVEASKLPLDDPKYLSPLIVNEIVKDLRVLVKEKLDYDLATVYQTMNESQVVGEAQGPIDAETTDSTTMKTLKSNKLPMVLAGLGLSLGAFGWLLQTDYIKDLLDSLFTKDVNIIQALQQDELIGKIGNGEGITQFMQRATNIDLGPNAPAKNLIESLKQIGGGDMEKGLKAIAPALKDPDKIGELRDILTNNPNGTMQDLFNQGEGSITSGKGGSWFETIKGAEVKRMFIKNIVVGITKTGIKAGAIAAGLGSVLAPLGLSLIGAAALVKGLRMKGLRSSRAQFLNDILQQLQLIALPQEQKSLLPMLASNSKGSPAPATNGQASATAPEMKALGQGNTAPETKALGQGNVKAVADTDVVDNDGFDNPKALGSGPEAAKQLGQGDAGVQEREASLKKMKERIVAVDAALRAATDPAQKKQLQNRLTKLTAEFKAMRRGLPSKKPVSSEPITQTGANTAPSQDSGDTKGLNPNASFKQPEKTSFDGIQDKYKQPVAPTQEPAAEPEKTVTNVDYDSTKATQPDSTQVDDDKKKSPQQAQGSVDPNNQQTKPASISNDVEADTQGSGVDEPMSTPETPEVAPEETPVEDKPKVLSKAQAIAESKVTTGWDKLPEQPKKIVNYWNYPNKQPKGTKQDMGNGYFYLGVHSVTKKDGDKVLIGVLYTPKSEKSIMIEHPSNDLETVKRACAGYMEQNPIDMRGSSKGSGRKPANKTSVETPAPEGTPNAEVKPETAPEPKQEIVKKAIENGEQKLEKADTPEEKKKVTSKLDALKAYMAELDKKYEPIKAKLDAEKAARPAPKEDTFKTPEKNENGKYDLEGFEDNISESEAEYLVTSKNGHKSPAEEVKERFEHGFIVEKGSNGKLYMTKPAAYAQVSFTSLDQVAYRYAEYLVKNGLAPDNTPKEPIKTYDERDMKPDFFKPRNVNVEPEQPNTEVTPEPEVAPEPEVVTNTTPTPEEKPKRKRVSKKDMTSKPEVASEPESGEPKEGINKSAADGIKDGTFSKRELTKLKEWGWVRKPMFDKLKANSVKELISQYDELEKKYKKSTSRDKKDEFKDSMEKIDRILLGKVTKKSYQVGYSDDWLPAGVLPPDQRHSVRREDPKGTPEKKEEPVEPTQEPEVVANDGETSEDISSTISPEKLNNPSILKADSAKLRESATPTTDKAKSTVRELFMNLADFAEQSRGGGGKVVEQIASLPQSFPSIYSSALLDSTELEDSANALKEYLSNPNDIKAIQPQGANPIKDGITLAQALEPFNRVLQIKLDDFEETQDSNIAQDLRLATLADKVLPNPFSLYNAVVENWLKNRANKYAELAGEKKTETV